MEAEVTGSVVAALFGLDGFCVLAAADAGGELELLVETIARVVPCPDCGAVARAKDRRAVWVRDLPIGGRPVVVCWHKRVWCCPHALCSKKTWTEQHPAIEPRACLTDRARAWAFEQVCAHDGAVLARHRTAPDDVCDRHRRPDTGSADAAARRGRRPVRCGARHLAARARRRLEGADRDRIAGPVPGYATALNQQLQQAVRVLDPFHVTKLGLTALDQVRRRVQQDSHGHRGHRGDPLYGIRRILRRRVDRLSERAWGRLRAGLVAGDPGGEVTAA